MNRQNRAATSSETIGEFCALESAKGKHETVLPHAPKSYRLRMTELVLHIGLHKTGTTSIQRFLSDNRASLLEAGIDFPLLGRTERGSQAHRHFAYYMSGRPARYPREFEAQVRSGLTSSAHCVLSAEPFYLNGASASIARLADLLPPVSKCIVFLREPSEHLLSLYGEALKAGWDYSLEQFMEYHLALLQNPGRDFAYYRSEENLSHWEALAPVIKVRYSKSADSVAKFFEAAKLPFDPAMARHEAQIGNPAKTDIRNALHLRINQAKQAGEIDAIQMHRCRAFVGRNGDRVLSETFAGYIVDQTVGTGRFVQAFSDHNPEFADLCTDAPDKLTIREFAASSAREVLDTLLKEVEKTPPEDTATPPRLKALIARLRPWA